MRVVKPPAQLSQWEAFIPKAQTEVPPGFQNAEEVAQDRGLSVVRAAVLLRNLEIEGKVETLTIRPAGRRNPMKYYRPVQNETQTQPGKKHRLHR